MDQDTTDSPRRAVRKRNKPQKYGDFLALSPTKRKVDREENSEDEMVVSEDLQQKPTALFSNDDIEGQDMFKFKSRHTRLDLQNKVKSAVSNSPKLDSPFKTPRKSLQKGLASPFGRGSEATPKHVREIIKKRIIKEVDSDSADSDFSGTSSDDFVPDDSDNETESSKASTADEEEEEQEVEIKKPGAKMQIVKSKDARRNMDSEYIVTPDNYFMMHSSKKITTSDHTLARLKHINLDENLNENAHMSEEHKTRISELNQSYRQLFDKWLYILSEDFNIVLYGIGSKRPILQQFQAEKLQDFPCIVINGFFPSLTMKSILETIVIDLLRNANVPANLGDIVSLVDTRLKEEDMDLFLIIHNIDGMMLRSGKAQAILAGLSQIQNVHTIASIDHINAPLLWDHSKLSKFKWSWWDVTSFQPYAVETSFEGGLGATRGAALQLSSLRSVFHSLTTNAKGIYYVIIRHQLENGKQHHYQGLPFKDLYSKCREQFLVSSDLALRAQLTEFLDHKLVKMKRTLDGSENLVIPIENSLLQQFLEQQES